MTKYFIILLLLLFSCTTHRTTLEKVDFDTYYVYHMDEEEIFRIVENCVVDEIKNRGYTSLKDNNKKGFQATISKLIDEAKIKIPIIKVKGFDLNGNEIIGFYVEVTSYGSYRPKQARKLATLINATLEKNYKKVLIKKMTIIDF